MWFNKFARELEMCADLNVLKMVCARRAARNTIAVPQFVTTALKKKREAVHIHFICVIEIKSEASITQ